MAVLQIRLLDNDTYKVVSESDEEERHLVVRKGSQWRCECLGLNHRGLGCEHIRAVMAWLDVRNDVLTPVEPVDPQEYLKIILSRFDSLEKKLEKLARDINNGNHLKDIPLTKFFSRFCALKAIAENHSTAKSCKTAFNRFFEFMNENHLEVNNLSELTPIIMSEYVKWLKERRIKKDDGFERLADRSINGYIKKIRHALEIVDKVGTQELREPLIIIKRPHLKKKPYIPTDEELARIPETLKILRNSDSEDARYLAFIGATVVQFCGRTNALSGLRFDMIEENGDGKPIVSYIGKHRVEQVKGLTNEWYKSFLKEWRKYVKSKYGDTQYFFPRRCNGKVSHLRDNRFRIKLKEFMHKCGLPQLTVHSFRYIYATKLYLKGVSPDEIKDILGVDKRTLKYYVKATQERKKKVLFTHLEKVSALPKVSN